MASSPVPSVPQLTKAVDIFERLVQCHRLLTAREVAQMLSVSPKTIYAYVARNMIPHYKIETSVRFSPKDIAEWIRKHAA
jgi:excisionase family DNA binding protein